MKFMHKAAKKWPKATRDTEANGPSNQANKSGGDKATAKSNTKLPQN